MGLSTVFEKCAGNFIPVFGLHGYHHEGFSHSWIGCCRLQSYLDLNGFQSKSYYASRKKDPVLVLKTHPDNRKDSMIPKTVRESVLISCFFKFPTILLVILLFIKRL